MARAQESGSYWSALLVPTLYKRNQGRKTRQMTAVALAFILFFGVWTLSKGVLSEYETPVRVGIPVALAVLGAWAIFRLVNWPRFANFLIAVEAEMEKVSWASRDEIIRATIVVIGTMVFLGGVLLAYDVFWVWFFKLIGVLNPET